MMRERDLGWVAAVLDIQGKVYRKNNSDRATPQLVVMVETAKFDVIRRLTRLTGISIEPQRQPPPRKDVNRRACITHCPEPHVHVEDMQMMPPIARWAITGISAAVVIHNVLSYMHTTDRAFRDLMEEAFQNAVMNGRGSGQSKKAVLRLMKLGWEVPPAILAQMISEEDNATVSVELICGHPVLFRYRPKQGDKAWCPRCLDFREVPRFQPRSQNHQVKHIAQIRLPRRRRVQHDCPNCHQPTGNYRWCDDCLCRESNTNGQRCGNFAVMGDICQFHYNQLQVQVTV